MSDLTWEHVQHVFTPDGALRDLYVLHTDEQDWDQPLVVSSKA